MTSKSGLKVTLLAFVLIGGGATALAASPGTSATDAARLSVAREGQAGSTHANQALPAALRPVFYQALAKDAGAAYRINKNGCAILSKQALKACFDGNGAHFSGAGSPLALHVAAWGRSGHLAAVPAVKPIIEGNRVSYAHGKLSAWWRVLPVGFEQGFTLAKRPSGNGALTLALATNGPAHQQNGTLGWGKLRYGKLVVTDAKGKVVPATLKSQGDRILIAVNDAHAVYPLTVDPLVWIEQKVIASDGAFADNFGISTAVSGTTALVGAYEAAVNGNRQGAVYVFSESGGTWTQTAKLTASDGAEYDEFGWSVALDGTTALVGAVDATVKGNYAQGAAYVFSDSGGTWTQTAKLAASDGVPYDFFGWSVALEGTTALVGAYNVTVNGKTGQGAAYVFSESNGTWTQAATLTASDGAANDEFGSNVALSGSTALVGADQGNSGGTGAAYVFSDSGGTWTQAAKLTASDGSAGDYFGVVVALSGTTALIGANEATVNGNTWQGAAYVFSDSGGTWTQTAKLTESDGAAQDFFGSYVALSGSTALIGAVGATVNGNPYQGAAYVFSDSGGAWTRTAKLTASDGAASDQFGTVALSGTTTLVGAAFATVNGNASQGTAYFYGQSDLGLVVSAPQTVGQGQNYVSQTIATNNASAASPAVTATITVPAAASFVSASASQGSCSEDSGVVSCDFGQINGNAGTATANVTLKATGNVGDTIDNAAGIAKATPPLSASAPTTITAGSACPDGYTEYDGNLNAGQRTHSPIYSAPAGQENAILTGPSGFQLYAVFQNARVGRKVYRIPGNEVHRRTPAGYFTWVVKAGDTAGAYTLCVQHP